MTDYNFTLRDWFGGVVFALLLAFVAWQLGAWLWRKTAFVDRLLKRRSS